MKNIKKIKKSLKILLNLNFTLKINIVVQMFLKVIDNCKEDEYKNIIKEMCDLVLNLPDYIEINNISVSVTFALLQFITLGRTQFMKLDNDLSYLYGVARDLTHKLKNNKNAFKVISKYI